MDRHRVTPDGPRHWSAGGDAALSQQLRLWAGLRQARQLLARLSGRDLTILLDRDLNPAPKPARSLDALSLDYGITREPVRQIGRGSVARVRRWSATAEFADVAAAAATLRDEFGPVIALAVVPPSFRPQGQPPRMAPEAALLVYLAGPYDVRGPLLVRRNFMDEVGVAVGDVMAASCVAPLDEVTDALDGLGVGGDDRTGVLSELSGYRLQGEHLLRWSGTQADKAEAVLSAEGHSLTLIAISGNIPERHAIRSLRSCLGSDPRFQRTGPKSWALSTWGGEPYPAAP